MPKGVNLWHTERQTLNSNIMKQKKQFRQLTDEELEQVTGGKEAFHESQDPCQHQEYKDNHPDECVFEFGIKTSDSK